MKESKDIPVSFKFPKKERLHSKKLIDALFAKGASFHLYPFTIKYAINPDEQADCHQMLVSVSKKRFKRAVDRNRIKRLVREAYRLQKQKLYASESPFQYLLIGYIYIAKEIHDYQFIEKKLIRSLDRLIKDINETQSQD